jgi:hypothetical protein
MASTYTNLKIQLMATGENTATWGNTTNVNLGTALEEAVVGSADVTFASGNVTLTLTDVNTSQTARHLRLNLTGTTGGARDLIVPAIEKIYVVNNGCADAVTVKNATGTGIAVPAGKTMWVYNNGTNVLDVVTHLSSLTLASALPAASGGTGITSLGAGVATFLGTPSSANLAAAVTDETGSGPLVFANSAVLVTPNLGTPSNIVLTNATALNVSNAASGTLAVARGGTGVTTSTGTGAVVLNSSPTLASPVLVTPNLGTPSNVVLTSGTGLPISTGVSGLGTGVATFLNTPSSANLAAAVTDETGSGALVFATSPTLVTPVLGTPTSVNLANATALNVSNAATGTLAVARGGTGQTTYTNGQLLIGNTTGNTLDKATITAGSGISITNGAGSITISSTGSGGTVTNVTLTTGSTGLLVNGATSASVTTAGNIAFTGTLAVANGGTGVTTSTGTGAVVLNSSPTLVSPVLGTPTSVNLANATALNVSNAATGTLAVARGGTGITSFGAGVADFLGTPSSANLATAVTDETGTGALVFGTSPALTTPNIGVPSFGTLTNCTGLPATTGLSGVGGATCTVSGSTLSVGRAWGIVSTVVRTAAGVYRVDFTTTMADSLYTVVAMAGGAYNRVMGEATATEGSRSTSSFFLMTQVGNASAAAGSLTDCPRFSVVVYA